MNAYLWAAWGLGGAFVYASSRLITALFADAELTPRMRTKAWAQFAVAIVFGPLAAGAVTGEAVRLSGGKLGEAAVALVIGLSANALWPLLVDEAGKGLKRLIGGWFLATGERLAGKEDKP